LWILLRWWRLVEVRSHEGSRSVHRLLGSGISHDDLGLAVRKHVVAHGDGVLLYVKSQLFSLHLFFFFFLEWFEVVMLVERWRESLVERWRESLVEKWRKEGGWRKRGRVVRVVGAGES
jgi:hypothetical protein